MKKDFILPEAILDTLTEADMNTAFICHSMCFGKEIGGIMIVSNTVGLHQIGIFPNVPQQPLFKLKMFVDNNPNFPPVYLLEFQALFANNRIVNVHLNPKEKAFRDYCKQCIKTDMHSIHFYNTDNKQTISVHVGLEMDMDWYERNLDISKGIRSNSFFGHLSKYIIQQNSTSDTFYFLQNKRLKFAGVK